MRGEAGSEWPPFKDIAEFVAVPKMTRDMLPKSVAPFVEDAAKSMDLPLEFFAVPMLVSASALIGHRVVALPRARGDWWQPGIVWGMVIGRPSIGKTPAEAKALHPFHDVMRAAEAAHVGESEPPRFKVSDATTEKIGELMASVTDGRALLQHCSELNGLFAAFARRGREADRSWYLQIWDLRTALLQDRIGRGTTKARCGLALYGAIQPGVLGQYVKAAKAGGIGADGFLQRFGLAVYPELPRTYRRSDHPPDLMALETATETFHRLANLDPGQLGAHPSSATVPFPGLRFTPDAQTAFDAWHDKLIERVRRNDDGASEAFLAHLGKQAGLVPSLALIFHLLDHKGGDRPQGATVRAPSLAQRRAGAAAVAGVDRPAWARPCRSSSLYRPRSGGGASSPGKHGQRTEVSHARCSSATLPGVGRHPRSAASPSRKVQRSVSTDTEAAAGSLTARHRRRGPATLDARQHATAAGLVLATCDPDRWPANGRRTVGC